VGAETGLPRLDELLCRLPGMGSQPKKFQGHPKLPKYRDKQGRNLLTYTIQVISRHSKNAGWIVPSGLPIRVATQCAYATIGQVRIVPHATHYTVEVVYDHEIKPADVDPQGVAGIDLGVNTLATLTTNQPGFTPLLVNGRPLKALNQLYNKRRAYRTGARKPPTAVGG